MVWVQRADLTGPPGSDADVTDHVAAPDPHPQYMTAAETAAAYQPLDADLTTIAGLTATTDSFLQSKSSAWTTRTPAQVKTDLALSKSDVGLGNVDNTADSAKPVSTAQQTALDGKQPLDTDLTTIAGLTATTDSILQAKSSAWTTRTPAQLKTDLAIVAGDITSGTFAIGRIPTGTTSSTVAIGNDTRLSVKPWPPVTLTDAGTVAVDASLGTHFRWTGTTTRIMGNPTNPTDGQVITFEFKASSGTPNHTWGTAYAFGSDITGTTAMVAGKTDYVQFVYASSVSKWQCIGYVKGYTT